MYLLVITIIPTDLLSRAKTPNYKSASWLRVVIYPVLCSWSSSSRGKGRNNYVSVHLGQLVFMGSNREAMGSIPCVSHENCVFSINDRVGNLGRQSLVAVQPCECKPQPSGRERSMRCHPPAFDAFTTSWTFCKVFFLLLFETDSWSFGVFLFLLFCFVFWMWMCFSLFTHQLHSTCRKYRWSI